MTPVDLAPSRIELTGVGVTYQSKKKRVDAVVNADLEVRPGELVAIRGASGAGKSSLLFAIAGIVPVATGRVVLDGVDATALDETAAAAMRLERIGLVFQFFHLLPALDAADNVALPLQLLGETHAEARRTAMGLLTDLGLEARATHRPRELSGGEQQRVAVARALVTQPSLILADEPTGNLDEESAHLVADLLVDASRGKRTLILATHDDRIATRLDRVVNMAGGRITNAGT
jgi:predicted ABC-type transport system involved in lysophospholipase L1 biosynthesis ATPase subunit